MNVIVKVTGMSEIVKMRNLSLKESTVTDGGVTFINITLLEDLISSFELANVIKLKSCN